jgi:dTDP-4-dehydrorhamnose reductase
MLGHRLFRHLHGDHDVKVTLREPLASYAAFGLFDAANSYSEVDAMNFASVEQAVRAHAPQAIVNAIGIVKQRPDSYDAVPSIEINALFPHRLAGLGREIGARVIHISTDCVFAGTRGNYNEDHPTDAEDLYGRSKLLGEIAEGPALTLRTSLIGRELKRKTGLLEWFLAQEGPIKGYKRAVFSGFTTAELSRVLEMLIVKHPNATGLYHVSSEPISKYDLLCLIRDKLGLATEIRPDYDFHCDRSLDSTRFRRRFDYQPPGWEAMIDELAAESAADA